MIEKILENPILLINTILIASGELFVFFAFIKIMNKQKRTEERIDKFEKLASNCMEKLDKLDDI